MLLYHPSKPQSLPKAWGAPGRRPFLSEAAPSYPLFNYTNSPLVFDSPISTNRPTVP